MTPIENEEKDYFMSNEMILFLKDLNNSIRL